MGKDKFRIKTRPTYQFGEQRTIHKHQDKKMLYNDNTCEWILSGTDEDWKKPLNVDKPEGKIFTSEKWEICWQIIDVDIAMANKMSRMI